MAGSGFGDLARAPGVLRIIAAQLTARFPSGMLSLGLLFHVEGRTGSYGVAGIVLAALSIGQALAGPATGRLMGRLGIRPVVVTTIVLCAAAVAAIALLDLPPAGLVVLALIAGLTFPPITSAVRTIYPKLVPSSMLGPLFSLDASLQELIWIGGPVLVTFLATGVSTTVALLVSSVLLVGGGAWFAASRAVGRVRIPRSKRRFGVVLLRPQVALMTLVGFLVIASCAAIEASVAGAFGEKDPTSGVVLAIWSLASLAGGFTLGRLTMRPWSLAARLVVVTVGAAFTPFLPGFWGLTLALVVSGFGLAPALGMMSAIVSTSVRFSDTAEAYGWTNTGQLVGVALGAALAGQALDQFGAQVAFGCGAALALLATIAAAAGIPVSPDLKGRNVGPIPDTAPVPLPPS
ncbi:MFS transporter [uncultured Amnibacterium sp.]|uniref:MFS transporter n=1 Tax=uncultured Amnibacterium sp. TaxID=1631851 RepID=UPI0035CC52DB